MEFSGQGCMIEMRVSFDIMNLAYLARSSLDFPLGTDQDI